MTAKSRFSVIVFCLLVSPITLSIAEQHDSSDYFPQGDKGIILDNSEHSGESAPHTVSVVRPNAIGNFENHTIVVKNGRYGIYITNGKVNVTLPKDIDYNELKLDDAIKSLAKSIQSVGDSNARLSSKEESLSLAVSNTESTRSRIEDADFAKEQMNMMKLQILQQTSVSSFSQANSAPQMVLSLFR